MSEESPKRFSDEEIRKFYLEFLKHQEHETHDREQLIQCMTENRQAVQELTESTKGLVEAWNATQGAVKVSVVIGSFVKWGIGIGAPFYALYHLLKGTGKLG